MHHFYIHKCFIFNQFLQKGPSSSNHHLHPFVEFVYLVLEFVEREAFSLTFSIAELLLCEENSILEGLSTGVGLDSSCI